MFYNFLFIDFEVLWIYSKFFILNVFWLYILMAVMLLWVLKQIRIQGIKLFWENQYQNFNFLAIKNKIIRKNLKIQREQNFNIFHKSLKHIFVVMCLIHFKPILISFWASCFLWVISKTFSWEDNEKKTLELNQKKISKFIINHKQKSFKISVQ